MRTGLGSSGSFSTPNPAGPGSSGGSRSPEVPPRREDFLVLNLVQPAGSSIFWDQNLPGSGSEGS